MWTIGDMSANELCLDSNDGGCRIAESNPLAARTLPKLYLFR